jgi:hypothetical protein
MKENLHYGSNTMPQEVEALCGDTSLTPEIRLKALELLQVERRLLLLSNSH